MAGAPLLPRPSHSHGCVASSSPRSGPTLPAEPGGFAPLPTSGGWTPAPGRHPAIGLHQATSSSLCRSRRGKRAGAVLLPFAQLPDLFLFSLSVPSASIKLKSAVRACTAVLVPLTFALEHGGFEPRTLQEPLNSLVSILLRVGADDEVQNSPGDGARRPHVRQLQSPLLFPPKPAFGNPCLPCFLPNPEVRCPSSVGMNTEA